jgi:hypothetical protein
VDKWDGSRDEAGMGRQDLCTYHCRCLYSKSDKQPQKSHTCVSTKPPTLQHLGERVGTISATTRRTHHITHHLGLPSCVFPKSRRPLKFSTLSARTEKKKNDSSWPFFKRDSDLRLCQENGSSALVFSLSSHRHSYIGT